MPDPRQLLWFKRDLRIHDHAPLCEAAKRGPIVGIYIFEPSLIRSPEFDYCHWQFIQESLVGLAADLSRLGSRLIVLHGEVVDIFSRLHAAAAFTDLWSHEETGNDCTYKRDLAVADWCRSNGVAWTEIPQNGVVRRLKSRDGWSKVWAERTARPILPPPEKITSWDCRIESLFEGGHAHDHFDATKLAIQGEPKPEGICGGESSARKTLTSFLESRGVNYQREMSSPVTAFDSCSRLSPYLAWGNISLRTVHQAARSRVNELREQQSFGIPVDRRWFMSINAFEARLRWHCHFMQKLESEPGIEFQNMMRSMDGLRENDFNESWFAAWCQGQTGYPLVDACMRALHRGGWINFRMRAMLASFSAYHLWLHWRRPAMFLARHFLDFEPGIHFSQFQMQSGTTGINTVRIYSPVKQVLDHDPTGLFIRRYVPELAQIPDEFLSEPHLMPGDVQKKSGCLIGKNYPAPLIEHSVAYKAARERISQFKKAGGETMKIEKNIVLKKHGSRKPTARGKKK